MMEVGEVFQFATQRLTDDRSIMDIVYDKWRENGKTREAAQKLACSYAADGLYYHAFVADSIDYLLEMNGS